MFLIGNTISLRALEPSDAAILYQWENDVSLWPVSFTQIPFSKFILEEFVNSAHHDIYTNKQLRLMITSNDSKETVGIIDLFEFDPQHERCGIGIYIHEKFQNKGYAFESIALIKKYCFQTLFLKQIYVLVSEKNTVSLSLFEKSGFEKTALKKSWNKVGQNSYENVWFMQCIQSGD